jgi:hypothetical protein
MDIDLFGLSVEDAITKVACALYEMIRMDRRRYAGSLI